MQFSEETRRQLLPAFLLWMTAALQTQAAGLSEVVEAALSQHPELTISQSRQAMAEHTAQRTQSLLAGDTAVNIRHKNDRPGSANGLSEWGVGLEMPLWLPGQKTGYRRLAAGLDEEASAALRLLAWQVAGAIRERAWDLRLARSDQDLAREQLQAAQALEDEVARRRAAGELSHSDWILARQETLGRQALLQEAEARVESANQAWYSYSGQNQLPDPLQEQIQDESGFPDSHPRLQASRSKISGRRAQRELQRTERRANPVLSLAANHERSDATAEFDDSLELSITLPLGSKIQSAPRLAQAEADLTEAEATHRLTRREIEQTYVQADLELQQTAAAIVLAETRNSLTAQGEYLARRAFELGESDLVQLLRARKEAADAVLDLQRKRLEHQRAIARRNQALGVMPK